MPSGPSRKTRSRKSSLGRHFHQILPVSREESSHSTQGQCTLTTSGSTNATEAASTAVGSRTSSESRKRITFPRPTEKPAFKAEFWPPLHFSIGMIRSEERRVGK